MMLHVQIPPITAAQIAENCPAKLTELGELIAVHVEKAERYEQKADDHFISAAGLLSEAKKLCDKGGFAAFRKRFNLGKTRIYELLAIASGKKSVAQIRAAGAERNRKFRAANKAAAAVRHETESESKPVPASPRPTTALQIAKADAQKARAKAVALMFPPETKRIPSELREALIAALGTLASGRADAAVAVERERARLSSVVG